MHPATILGLGFILGLEHALDADHIVAISTIVSKQAGIWKASILGAIWGLGHTTTLFVAGLAVLLLKISVPDQVALSMEFLVGLMIIALGINVLIDLFIKKKHLHRHSHGKVTHTHFHAHKKQKTHKHYHRPFLVGIVHGLAGSAALMLLVLSTVKSTMLGLMYIMVFGVGSMLGMAIVSSLIGLPFVLTSSHELLNKRVRYVAGVFSIGFGLYLIAQISGVLALLLP